MRRENNFDRRSNARFDVTLPLKIAGADFHMATDTKNISCTGLYCHVTRFLPVMTKLSISLFVPLIVKERKVEKQINCAAVVVRTEPDREVQSTDIYYIGMFFTDIKEKDRETISKYIQQAFFAGKN
ncbi:MAG: PilZ domain-containing protein [Candidatus Omnitrophica bacterium]|nr:PilZ domain-containing protein [Candidatus Omnitrophota bacterium]MBU4479034.1 PilZ domain-containing protein [Candidatus Omnitrophota bacterium]MCG2703046.1 PilZ domain-containing protein [Candidatus Omnitrophota bacterium]